MKNGFSIVLCTHNGQSRLEPTLTHIAALEVPIGNEVELLLIDNDSTDNTVSFAKGVWDKLNTPFPLIILQEKRRGKGYAVETGYDAASYSYILTVDDDNWLQADYLTQAFQLFQDNPTVGILQGHNVGVFETEPPVWLNKLKKYFILGGPKDQTGYFPQNDFYVWGAGMLIKNIDWKYLRSLGYASLTSKLPGKAAGEDNELAIGILLLGKKIYYSAALCYQHFMPTGRMNWDKLKQNFDTFSYVDYYFFLYGVVVDSYKRNVPLTKSYINAEFYKYWIKYVRHFTWKHQLRYWIYPNKEEYQLQLQRYYTLLKWFWKLRSSAEEDTTFLQSWMIPLLKENKTQFQWPL